MAQHPNLPRELESAKLLVSLGLRVLILMTFASFGNTGFGRGLATLLWMSIVLAAVIATMKREPAFDVTLNHWDEAVAYAALFSLVGAFNHVAPV